MTLSPIQQDWFIALAVCRQATGSHDVTPVWDAVEDNVTYTEQWQRHAVEPRVMHDGAAGLFVAAHFESAPQIERVEVLTYAACAVWFNSQYGGNAFERTREAFTLGLCKRASVCPTNTADIRERWRLITAEQATHLLLYSQLESRRICGICHTPVATGAGAWSLLAGLHFDEWAYLPIAQRDHLAKNRPSPEHNFYRGDIHESCYRYAHEVLAPRARRQLAAEREAYNKGAADGE